MECSGILCFSLVAFLSLQLKRAKQHDEYPVSGSIKNQDMPNQDGVFTAKHPYLQATSAIKSP